MSFPKTAPPLFAALMMVVTACSHDPNDAPEPDGASDAMADAIADAGSEANTEAGDATGDATDSGASCGKFTVTFEARTSGNPAGDITLWWLDPNATLGQSGGHAIGTVPVYDVSANWQTYSFPLDDVAALTDGSVLELGTFNVDVRNMTLSVGGTPYHHVQYLPINPNSNELLGEWSYSFFIWIPSPTQCRPDKPIADSTPTTLVMHRSLSLRVAGASGTDVHLWASANQCDWNQNAPVQVGYLPDGSDQMVWLGPIQSVDYSNPPVVLQDVDLRSSRGTLWFVRHSGPVYWNSPSADPAGNDPFEYYSGTPISYANDCPIDVVVKYE